MSKQEVVLGFIECKSITTCLSNTSQFSFAKSGHVQIIKDWIRRSYVLKLVSKIDSKNPTGLMVNINRADIPCAKFKVAKIILKTAHGVISIEPLDPANVTIFEEKFNFCLKDEDLSAGELKINLDKKPTTPKLNNIIKKIESKNENQEETKEKLVEIPVKCNLNEIVQTHQAIKKETQIPNELPTKDLTETTNLISKSKFYNTSSGRPITTENRTSKILNDFKDLDRRPLMPKIQLSSNKRNRDDSENEKLINIVTIQKRKKLTFDLESMCMNYDQENQENKKSTTSGSINFKRWNRSTSMNSFGNGFLNLGNTCYMNAILQCLINIDIFSNELSLNYKEIHFFNDDSSTKKLRKECLFFCLCELLKAREHRNESSQNKWLKEIKNSIAKEAFRFSGFSQQDAHEFLCQVLDQLKDDVDKLRKEKEEEEKSSANLEQSRDTKNVSNGDNNNEQKSENYNLSNIQSNQELKTHPKETNITTNTTTTTVLTNPIVDNFQFQVDHQITCEKCNNIIHKTEEYNNLCLELPQSKSASSNDLTLQNTLEVFFQDEHLNDFKCEKCNNVGVCIMRKFVKLPRILILHLKRYQFQEIEVENEMEAIFNDNVLPDEAPITETPSKIMHKLVKNDSEIMIPRHLFLDKLICDNNDLKQPKPVSKLVKLEMQNNKNQSKETESAETKQHNNLNLNEPKTPNLSKVRKFGVLSETKTGENIKQTRSPLGTKNLNSPLTNKQSNSPYGMKHGLVNSKVSLTDDTFNKINKTDFNSKEFFPDLSENDQIKRALRLSLSNSIESDRNVTIPKLFTLDGQFDADSISDVEFEDSKTSDSEVDSDMINKMKKKSTVSKTTTTRLRVKRNNSDDQNQLNHAKTAEKETEVIEIKDDDTPNALATVEDEDEENTKLAIAESLRTFKSENNYKISTISDPITPETQKQKLAELKKNQKTPDPYKNPNSYRLIGIVNHIGASSNSGHYIADVYDNNKSKWFSYDDKQVESGLEDDILLERSRTGYIFFYIHNSLIGKNR